MFSASFEYAKDEIDRRLKNPFWGSFVLAWVGWNWRVWYLTIFVDDKIVGNKINYIEKMYDCFNVPLLGFFLNWIIAPVFIGFLVIWFLPKVTDKFLQKQQENKEREDGILLKNLVIEKQILEEKGKVAEQTLQTIEKEWAIKKIEQENKNDLWDREYTTLINKYPNLIKILAQFIYGSGGEIYENDPNTYDGIGDRTIEMDIESILHINELIIKSKDAKYQYFITEKWRYFLKRASLE